MTPWSLQQRISRHLLVWSALSSVGGALLLFGTPFWRGVGLQGLVWGAIDAAIAGFGLASLRRKRARPDADAPAVLAKEARNLRRLLLVNAGLDVLYVVGGIVVLTQLPTPFARGNGVGIVVQGAFLLLLDTFYAFQANRVAATLAHEPR